MTKRCRKTDHRTMSTHAAPAPNMTETSVIRHYKKQLIYRQHDVPEHPPPFLNEVSNTKIYDLVEPERPKHKQEPANGKKIKRKRKNKNCRGQFRHEGMELIKLGANSSHPPCKPKDPRAEKPPLDYRNVPDTAHPTSVIQTNHVKKTILETLSPKPPLCHALPQMVPERRNSRELPPKPPVLYRPVPSEYRPPYPHMPCPYPAFRSAATLPPPPPYPVNRSPPRPVPRPPIRPIPQPAGIYSGMHFPFVRHPEYRNGNECKYQERRKRKLEEKEHPVVAAIDLTVDSEKRHECKCDCGKKYTSGAAAQEVIITVKEKDSSQVPSTYVRGKMVNGMLQLEQNKGVPKGPQKTNPPVDKGPPPTKPPPLFRIDDLLGKNQKDSRFKPEVKPVPIKIEHSRVIISPRKVEELKPKSKDHSVSTIIGSDNRRQSVEIDTISVSSSGSESVRSPRPKSEQIPHGKLYHYKNNNSFIRYFDDAQKQLFMDSLTSDGHHDKSALDEVIKLPPNAFFSTKDSLTVEEYVSEMTLVENFIPKDFFLFYKFVTGYQICNNNLPVSFLTFLKVYNTNGLKVLLERYISSLKQN